MFSGSVDPPAAVVWCKHFSFAYWPSFALPQSSPSFTSTWSDRGRRCWATQRTTANWSEPNGTLRDRMKGKETKKSNKRRTKSRLLIETQSLTNLQTATTDLADDSIIKQLNFFLFSSCCLGCIKPHKSWTNWCYFVVVFLFMNKRHLLLYSQRACSCKETVFGLGYSWAAIWAVSRTRSEESIKLMMHW